MPEIGICNLVKLGRVEYQTAWDLQRRLAAARATGQIDDTLLLLEHPHTYTLGRSADEANLLLSPAERETRGVTVVDVDRGGDITYHGPGQLVTYPILYLGETNDSGRLVQGDYVGYLRRLEAMLIQTLARYGISARRKEGYTGVWVDTRRGPQKIAAIGVHVDARGISTHGAALNVRTDLSYFEGIIPCGISEYPVTSIESLTGTAPTIAEAAEALATAFASEFNCRLLPVTLGALLPEKAPSKNTL